MDGIFFIPSLFVIAVAFGYRYVIRRKPLGIRGWLVSVSLVVFLSFFLPLIYGVWLPDVFGKQHTLCSATTSTGYQISIVQYWNHVDFYTTEARIAGPDGVTSLSLLDGDASKAWSATLEVDPSEKSATFKLPNGRSGEITW
ncbi:MAG: hypothetical protein ACRDBP_00295 [Luteolibacter sp.]